MFASNEDGNRDASAWWRAQKASCCSDFGSLTKALEYRLPPPMPYAMEHSSEYTYTSRDTPAKLLMSLCCALVYADVQISNKAKLLEGECWVIRGFFFAMYRRTCLDISVFTSGTDGELLVEMQRMQGDRDACTKLCAHLQQQCRLSAYTHTWEESDTTNASTTTPPIIGDYPKWELPHSSPATWQSDLDADAYLMRGCAMATLQPLDPQPHNNVGTATDMFSKGYTPKRSRDISRGQNPGISPPRHPLNLHLCNALQPMPLPSSVLDRCNFDKNENSMKLLRSILRLQAESRYHETKLSAWQDVAAMTTDPHVALNFLNICVESCDGKHENKTLASMVTLLQKGDHANNDLQYCVLASLFNAVQAAKHTNVSLLHPDVLGPMAAVVAAGAKFADPLYGGHLRAHAIGVAAWFSCQLATASIRCGATLPLALPTYTPDAMTKKCGKDDFPDAVDGTKKYGNDVLSNIGWDHVRGFTVSDEIIY